MHLSTVLGHFDGKTGKMLAEFRVFYVNINTDNHPSFIPNAALCNKIHLAK
jgi:hypothetical protein